MFFPQNSLNPQVKPLQVLMSSNQFFIQGKIAIDLIDFFPFIAILCDFFLGNQSRHREKTEEDCKDLLPSMVSLVGTVESSK